MTKLETSAGAPTEYKEEFVQKTYDYIKERKDEITEFHKTRGEKSDGYDRLIKVKIPTKQGLASYLGVSSKSVDRWSALDEDGKSLHPKFSLAIAKLVQEQHDRLVENGLSGDYNPTIAKLLLSANHDYKEKSDITSGDEKITSFEVIIKK